MNSKRVGLAVMAAVTALGISSGVAQARPEPAALQQQACDAMDAGMSFYSTVHALVAVHSGLEDVDGAWAALHGVANYCPWHEKDVPSNLQKYIVS